MIVCILSYLSSMNGRMMIMPSSRSMRISTILAAACLLVSSCRAFVHPTTRNNRLPPPPSSSSLLLFASSSRKQPPKKRRFSQAAHNVVKPTRRKPATKKNPPQRKKQELWQSSKSIEELEATMTKRWGTEMDKWTADPNEYELFVEDPEDAEGGVFRAKPVLDPWQETTTQEAPLSDYNENDVVMNRVRRNQERLQRKQQEFYDEDDEGYEPNDRYSQNEDIRIDHLIAPQPVGGRGTKEPRERENESPGYYFFNANAVTKSQTEMIQDSTVNEDSSPKRRRRRQSIPVLDDADDGQPIYLTLQQAKRDFEASLASPEKRSDTYQPLEPKSWTELGITSETLLENLEKMKCARPLAVQDKACPSVVTGNDVLVGTYTGSGKTLAFLVPLAQELLFSTKKCDGVQVLIVAPGRELASQIVSVARELLEGTDITAMLAIGGTTFSRNLEQIRKRKPSILVGTPGRIAELVVGRPGEKSGRLKVNDLRALVLDEFDALLEYKPHRDPTRAIITTLKKRHGDSLQTILCSATASDMIGSKKLENFLRPGFVQAMADRNDRLITASDDVADATRVSSTAIHGVIHVPHRRLALETLRSILYTEPTPQQVLIFADNARRVDIVIEKLAKMGVVAAPLHGGYGSEKVDRAEVSKALREGYVGIVVATELAARGLDAPLLTHVINLDLPTDASHYAHRAGRCGRGGRPGVVINITTQPKERSVPQRFADSLGITMHNVEARSGKLNIVEPDAHLDENYRS